MRDRDLGSNRVTIWVSSRLTGTTTIRRMPVEGGNIDRSATRLAVESVELIRASLAGLWPSSPVPRPPETFTREPPPGPGVAVALSVGRMTDFGDAPSFWAPQLAASWGRPDGFGVRLTASGSVRALTFPPKRAACTLRAPSRRWVSFVHSRTD